MISSVTTSPTTGPKGGLLIGASVTAKRQSPTMSGQASSIASLPNIHLFSAGSIPGTIMQVQKKSPNSSEDKIAEARN